MESESALDLCFIDATSLENALGMPKMVGDRLGSRAVTSYPLGSGPQIPIMEIYQIIHFIAVVETGSFTKGADRAAVSQSAISASIAKLEAEFDVQLLDRRRSPVVPTDAGERLLEATTEGFASRKEPSSLETWRLERDCRIPILRSFGLAIVSSSPFTVLHICRIALLASSKRSPASVGTTGERRRSSNWTSNSASSFATLADMADCETAARSAPFVKLPVSTTAMKCMIW
jgi:DNA-binding MarR family transcriptional regulator